VSCRLVFQRYFSQHLLQSVSQCVVDACGRHDVEDLGLKGMRAGRELRICLFEVVATGFARPAGSARTGGYVEI